MRKIKAGFVGFGEVNTPREIIIRKCNEARRQIEAEDIELVWTDPVSDDPDGNDVTRAKKELAREDFDVLIICVAGWIPSHAVIGVIDAFRNKPMLLWGLTGWKEDGRFVTTADQAGTTALRKPMEDLGYQFKYVVNYYGGTPPMEHIVSYARAAHAVSLLRGARIGMMGYRDMKLYGTLYDGVSLRAKIGPEVEFFEMLEMVQAIEKLDQKEITQMSQNLLQRWNYVKNPTEETLQNTARLYSAVRQKVRERGYGAISLIDVDGVKKLMNFAPAGVFMLLHENEGICTIPENDTMGAVTQLMTRYLTGQVGAYLEFYEFMENGMLMGVPDYVPSEIVDGQVSVLPTSFGEFGEGLLNVSKIKPGEVTLARMSYTGNQYCMHVVTGEGHQPRHWEEAGWKPPAPQLPSLEVMINGSIENFIQNVLGQHYILSYGNNTQLYKDICAILDIEML